MITKHASYICGRRKALRALGLFKLAALPAGMLEGTARGLHPSAIADWAINFSRPEAGREIEQLVAARAKAPKLMEDAGLWGASGAGTQAPLRGVPTAAGTPVRKARAALETADTVATGMGYAPPRPVAQVPTQVGAMRARAV